MELSTHAQLIDAAHQKAIAVAIALEERLRRAYDEAGDGPMRVSLTEVELASALRKLIDDVELQIHGGDVV